MLTSVREIHPEQGRVTAAPCIPNVAVHPHDGAPEADRDVLVCRVATHQSLVLSEVVGVVGPTLQRDDRQLGAVAHDDLEVAGVIRRPGVIEDDQRLGVVTGFEHMMPVAALAGAVAVQVDPHRTGELGLGRDAEVQCLVGVGRCHDCAAVLWHQDGAAGRHAESQGTLGEALGPADLDRDRLASSGRLIGEEAAEAVHRGEAPLLFATVRDREVGNVERADTSGTGLIRHPVDRALRVDVGAGLSGGGGNFVRDQRHQPTAPSI